MRLAQGVPPHVHVVNLHDEEITVVVSKYRPDRMVSGIGINASATGAGLDFSTTVCHAVHVPLCFEQHKLTLRFSDIHQSSD